MAHIHLSMYSDKPSSGSVSIRLMYIEAFSNVAPSLHIKGGGRSLTDLKAKPKSAAAFRLDKSGYDGLPPLAQIDKLLMRVF